MTREEACHFITGFSQLNYIDQQCALFDLTVFGTCGIMYDRGRKKYVYIPFNELVEMGLSAQKETKH